MTEQTQPKRISFRYFWKIFLLAAFPIHVWNLLMIFKDMEFVTERSEMAGAIGYAGYSLIVALAESLIFGLLLWGISLLLPKKWPETRSIAVLFSAYFVLSGASMVEQAFNAWNEVRISRQFLYGMEHFTTLTYALIIVAILLAIAVLLLIVFKTKKGEAALADFYERLMLLSYLYLLLDIAGIVIVINRNWV